MNQRIVAVLAIVAGVALAWAATGGPGNISAQDAAPGSVPALPAEQRAPDETASAWPAGAEYKLSDTSVDGFKSSLAALWTWQGDEGTFADGQTRVRVVGQGGRVAGVEIVKNASVLTDDCLKAQLLYGVSLDLEAVNTACAGMWTREWAEAQGAKTGAEQ